MEVSVLRVIAVVSALLLVVGISFYTSAISAEGLAQIRIGHLDFDNIPVIELKEGQQGDLEMEPVYRNVGHGLAPVYLYRLPEYSKPSRLFLTTIVNRQKIFYPIVALLNEDRLPVDVIKRPVNLKRISQVEISSSMPIIVNPQHKYMLITTDPAYFGEHLSYKKHVTSMIREYDGYRMNYVPVTTGTRDVDVVIATSGRLALSVPENDY